MSLQTVLIREHELRSSPSSHVVYKIEIQASVRSWTLWRRYSEFVDLNTELTKSTGAPPPQDLPPKHSFSLRRKLNQDTVARERCGGLQAYLRAIVASKDPRWREAFAFREFLGMPAASVAVLGQSDASTAHFSNASWIDEHSELQALVRDIRADINKRDSLGDRGEVGPSANANVQAKKKLVLLVKRMTTLAKGLESLGLSGMSEGELHRRSEMVARLQDDCEKMGRMIVTSRSHSSASAFQSSPPPNSEARAELLGTSHSTPVRPITRVFGAPAAPRETDVTRPLDDEGLFSLQQQQMNQQDTQLAQLGAILQRQKHLGIAIGNELEEQIAMLDDLNEGVDKFGVKLGAAKKQMNRLG